ncbi:hypothetical protein [Pseudomonas sp.]|uniref:hypothetical protein n=1 Tax=Pseudomonas sp. TaxID=306 RepID=UPI002B81D607|nr:hypothetical protein [Pseudomonas sp.]HUE91483.1 hypothetical protein [Pseudomonas sp.]
MRNQLTTRTSSIPEVVYSADGQLDGHSVEIVAWSRSRLALNFGPCSLSLTPVAMIELITHLHNAMDSIVKAQTTEQEVKK